MQKFWRHLAFVYFKNNNIKNQIFLILPTKPFFTPDMAFAMKNFEAQGEKSKLIRLKMKSKTSEKMKNHVGMNFFKL